MLKPIEIVKDIFYVGVNDRTKPLFESLWPIPEGVSYNSYLIVDQKSTLMDTVDICYSDIFLQKLESALDGKPLDYLVINHMEPDHSGSLGLLKQKYPNIEIVGNKRTAEMVAGYHGITEGVKIIEDGDQLSLGKHELTFYLTPMIHWPETMMTYESTSKSIFTGDAFGSFGTLDGGIMDKQMRPEKYYDEMARYYANIVGKFGNQVQRALAKLNTLEIANICSTHGPIWTQKENVQKVIALYDQLSKYEGNEGVVIAYGSMYGNTEQMAETIAYELARNGIKDIVMHNLSKSHSSFVLRDIFKYSGLIIGSPTYNNKLFPAVESLLGQIEGRDIKNRILGYFGSFTWAGAAIRDLKQFADESKFEVLENTVEMKHAMTIDTHNQCVELGKAMADRLKQEREEK